MRITTTSFGEQVVEKIRWFIVVQSWKSHCIAVPVHTYNRQGLTKPGLYNAEDHAALTLYDTNAEPLPGEELVRKPLRLILEDKSLKVDQTSRINFSKLYTVEYNIKVSTVGRIINRDHHLLDEYVTQSIKLCVESGRGKSQYEETEDGGRPNARMEYVVVIVNGRADGQVQEHKLSMVTAPVHHSLIREDIVRTRLYNTVSIESVPNAPISLLYPATPSGFLWSSHQVTLTWRRPNSLRTHETLFYLVPGEINVDILLGYPDSGGGHQVQRYSQPLQTEHARVQAPSWRQVPQYQPLPPEPVRVQTPNWRWWIPAEGISRDVIQADIGRYLGPEALVRPGDGTDQYAVSRRNVTRMLDLVERKSTLQHMQR